LRIQKDLGAMNSKMVVKIRVRCLHNKVSSRELVLRKVSPLSPNPKLIRNSGWPEAEYNKVSSTYVWCVGVLVRSNFGLGGRGKSAHPIFGDVTLLCKHRKQKRASKEFPRPSFFSFSIILPIHGLQNGVVSPAKGPKTLKHRKE